MIGLDTGHLVYNYGTKLQAYAMQNLLEQNGEKCEIIQWHVKDYKILNFLSDFCKRVLTILKRYRNNPKYWIKAYKRYKAFDKFNSKFHIHKFYGSYNDMKNYTSIYDKAFCGSDQAWLPQNVEKHWYTLEYFSEKTVKAAYAPSFGLSEIEEIYYEGYHNFLTKFDFLSVREFDGKRIIKKITNKEVPVVLDPTLLITRDTWDQLLLESKISLPKEKYIFCYFLGENREHRDSVKKIQLKKKYKIVNLQFFMGFCPADKNFADYNLYDVSPQDFIKLIANASYICTDSFHCTAFCIHYQKNFSVFHRFSNKDKLSTNSRIHSLLSQLDLETRIVDDGGECNEKEINYEMVNKKLQEQRIASNEFLREALRGKKNV